MSDEKSSGRGNGDASSRVPFDYIKSQHFRVIRADGVIGGVTPSGYVHMAFFSERPAIPRRVVHQANLDGSLGKEIDGERVSRDSIVREMDVDLFVSLDFARNLHGWLGQRIAELEARTKKSGDKTQ